MSTRPTCPECKGEHLRRTRGVGTRGGHGPDLLPGLHGFWRSAKVDVVLCTDCGLVRYYADLETRTKAKQSKRWTGVR